MSYDPFARGAFPVGVRTLPLEDPTRGRSLPSEIWYPATDAFVGRDRGEERDTFQPLPIAPPQPQDAVRDADPRDGRFPVVIFSHGFGGHRRQSTFYCTHLASHGYVVAACDHSGNTIQDVMALVMQVMSGGDPPDAHAVIGDFVEKRPPDARLLLDRVLDGSLEVIRDRVDPDRIGISGHSFGGWTTLAVAQRDPRIGAALPLAPAGGRTPVEPDPFEGTLDLAWERAVPTLYLVAERDSLLPLDGMHKLYASHRDPKRMVVLDDADHLHFCDGAATQHEFMRSLPRMGPLADLMPALPPMSELCSEEAAHHFTRGLGLAHFDAALKADADAEAFLSGDVKATLAERRIQITVA